MATNTDTFETTTASTTPPAGTFSVSVPISGGTTALNIVAVSPDGKTAHAKRTIVFDFTAGTVLLDVTDPDGDDNGPGNNAYPTSSGFHPGAFDIQEFKVILSPDASTVTFKLQVRDLSPTFGSPLGAQLVDVYVHDPAAAAGDTSTAPAFPQRNYIVAAGVAWSRLLEVQGFGQRYIDAHGATIGTITISANAISRFITFSAPPHHSADNRARAGASRLSLPVRMASPPIRHEPSPRPRARSPSAFVRPRAEILTALSIRRPSRKRSTY